MIYTSCFVRVANKNFALTSMRIILIENFMILNSRELQDGTLKQNGIVNGSKIIVTPNVETGLVS